MTCKNCPLYGITLPVYGRGPAYAKLFIIGEAPGANEEKQGLPFVGRAGKELSNTLAMAGFVEEDCYITNTVHCRPTDEWGDNRPPTDEEMACCGHLLEKEMEAVSFDALVLLGNTARHAMNVHDISKDWAGKIYDWAGPIMTVWHPSYVMRSGRQREYIDHFKRLKREMEKDGR